MTTKYFKKNNKSFGFTLIELLVAISIIGILSSILLISFSNAQKQARNTQRKSDIRQYQNSLELYANRNNGFFPSRTGSSGESLSTIVCPTDLGLSSCPEDKRNSEDATHVYNYQSDGTGAGNPDAADYVIWGKLENVSTTTYWAVCSGGASGEITTPPTGGACPI